MSETRIKIVLMLHPGADRKVEIEATVDTGATYSWIPKNLLEEIGARPSRRVRFKTIEGRIVEREVGYIFVEWNGEVAPTVVVFAEEEDQSVVGLHMLESLGLEVDPTSRRVKKSEALLAL